LGAVLGADLTAGSTVALAATSFEKPSTVSKVVHDNRHDHPLSLREKAWPMHSCGEGSALP
jgi:hypothetical protein